MSLPGLAVVLMLLAGCATVPTERELAAWQGLAEEAAFVGAAVDMADHPARRAQYATAAAALHVLLTTDTLTMTRLRAALAGLPDLRGSTGAIVSGSVVSLYVLGAGFVDLDTAPRLRAVTAGLVNGLDRALQTEVGGKRRDARFDQVVVPER